MSLALLRDGPLSSRRSDRAASLRKRSSQLRALNAITATITQHCGLAPSLDTNFDAGPSPQLTPSESRLLDDNDLEKGRYFQESSLQVSIAAIESISPFKAPTERLDGEVKSLPEKLNPNDVIASKALLVGGQATEQTKLPSSSSKDTQPGRAPVEVEPTRADSGPIRPSDVAKQHPDHHPKTVHLPPKEVQEERMRARRQSRDELRAAQLKEAEGHAVDLASSPSSTVGAWSTATPLPADPSPMTSIGEEPTVPADLKDKKPEHDHAIISDETANKRDHDSLLDAQKEAARREILGPDLASPDVQLRLEQEQAAKASRDAEAMASTFTAASTESRTEAALAAGASERTSKESSFTVKLAEQAGAVPATTDVAVKPQLSQTPQPQISKDTSSVSAESPVATAVNPAPAANINVAPSGRMTTRVSSGTMRQKSVSEIIGETPRVPHSSTKRASIPEPSPSAVSPRSRSVETSTTRQQRVQVDADTSRPAQVRRHSNLPVHAEGYQALRGAAEDPAKDYLEPLFRMQTYENLPINKTLSELLARASKVVSTADQFAGIHERQDHRILRRIYGLQNANKWSLRQMQPCLEPAPPKTHMDYVIAEMKWMRTDFRQERKIKKMNAKFFAEQCAEWVSADASQRRSMQVFVRPLELIKSTSNAPHSPAETNFENGEPHSQDARSPPELESSNEQDDSSVEDFDSPRTPSHAVAPTSIMKAMNVDGKDDQYQVFEQMQSAIGELPLYAPFEEEPVAAQPTIQRAVPSVSKYCDGKIMTKLPSPIKKRSRFDYEDEDEDDVLSQVPQAKRLRAREGGGIPPQQNDVALFDPDNKLLRDRLHSNTAFRPPSEFPMPSSHFYEFRTSSQWIAEDDQHLRRLAKDYSFNWSLIADEMSLPSCMSGAAERRTPWECFERWVELESLPNEMRKTLYFKTWNQRIEAAQRNNDMRYQAQLQQQSQTPNQPQNIVRRRTQPVRVEKRRTSRYLHVVDAMRKNARKREQHAHKQAEAQKAASLRKQHESTAPKSAMHSPAEFSRLRHERDVAYAQRQEQYRQQVIERQRQAAMQQRGGQFAAGQPGHANATQQRPVNVQQLQPGQPQQAGNNSQIHPAQQQGQAPQRNGTHLAVPQMGMQGSIPQAQMQANMRGGNTAANHGSTDSMQQQRIALEQAHRQAQMKQQAQLNGQQFQMGPPNRVSPGGPHSQNGMINGQANPAMMATMQQSNSSHASTPNGTSMQQNYTSHPNNAATSASPNMPPPPNPAAQPQQQPQQLSSGLVPAISVINHQIREKHPNATPEQLKEMTSQHLKQYYSAQQTNQQARQSAMHAAAGTHGVVPSPNNQAAYSQNQSQNQAPSQVQNQNAFQQNNATNVTPNNGNNTNMQTNGHQSYANSPTPNSNGVSQSPIQYSAAMRQQLIQQRQNQLQSAHVQAANGSPHLAQASPNVAHVSPNMAQAVPNMNSAANRTPTPQMPRLGSSGSQSAQGPLQSPGLPQASPRAVPAGVAQRQ